MSLQAIAAQADIGQSEAARAHERLNAIEKKMDKFCSEMKAAMETLLQTQGIQKCQTPPPCQSQQ
jgi:hypothetical protein